jgi:hypothetical protein
MDSLEAMLGLDEDSQRQKKEFEEEIDYSFRTKVRWDHVIENQKKP